MIIENLKMIAEHEAKHGVLLSSGFWAVIHVADS